MSMRAGSNVSVRVRTRSEEAGARERVVCEPSGDGCGSGSRGGGALLQGEPTVRLNEVQVVALRQVRCLLERLALATRSTARAAAAGHRRSSRARARARCRRHRREERARRAAQCRRASGQSSTLQARAPRSHKIQVGGERTQRYELTCAIRDYYAYSIVGI